MTSQSNTYKDNWTQPWPMGSKIYPKVHENLRTFFSSSSPILLEPLASKRVSTPDNLTEATRTTLVKATTLNTEQHLSMLRALTSLWPSYSSRPLPSTRYNLPRHQTTSFACKPAQSLEGLYTIQGPQNTRGKLCGTPIDISALYVSSSTETRMSKPQQPGY